MVISSTRILILVCAGVGAAQIAAMLGAPNWCQLIVMIVMIAAAHHSIMFTRDEVEVE